MIELNQLRCFVAVAEELHFGRAAKRLFMTQPPLSRQIQLLEHALGARLLERTNRHVSLTASGKTFLRDAKLILEFTGQAQETVKRVEKGEIGRLMLGFTAVSGYWQIPQIIALAAQELPEITLVMKEMVSSAQLQALAARTLDIGFVRQPVTLFPLAYHCVLREPLCVALPASSSLTAKPRLRLRDFAGQPFIMYSASEGKYFYDCIAGLFAQANVVPHYVQHCSQTHTILGLVRAGVGLAIVPDSARQLAFPDIEFRPLSHPDAVAEIHMAWRQDGETPALAAFRQLVIAHCTASGAIARKKLTVRRSLPKLR